jgi:predicted translin family RNA/ssDNA-binding protein
MPYESVSSNCYRTGQQNCHICENADCGDNTTPDIVRLREDLAAAQKEREEIIRAAKHSTTDPKLAAANVVIKNMKQDLKIAKEMLKRAEKQRDEIADECQKMGARLDEMEKVVVEALVTFGGKTIPLKEMVDAVKTAKIIGKSLDESK